MPSPHPSRPHACSFKVCTYTTMKLGNLKRHAAQVHNSSSTSICKFCPGAVLSQSSDQYSTNIIQARLQEAKQEEDSETSEVSSDLEGSDGVSSNESYTADSETDNESVGSEEEEVETLSDGEDDNEVNYSLWKRLKQKALEIDDEDPNILKHVIRIYLADVELKLLLDSDRLHKKLLKSMRKKMKETDRKTAFDYVFRIYRPALVMAVFNMDKDNVKLSKRGTIFENLDEEDDVYDAKDLWHDKFLAHIIDNDDTVDVETDELYADIEKKSHYQENQVYVQAINRHQ